MTMPHMMNCGHSDTGWCLDCVRALHDENEKHMELIQRIQGALGTEDDGEALVEVARNAYTAELENAAALKAVSDDCPSMDKFTNIVPTVQWLLQKWRECRQRWQEAVVTLNSGVGVTEAVIQHTPQDDTILRLRREIRDAHKQIDELRAANYAWQMRINETTDHLERALRERDAAVAEQNRLNDYYSDEAIKLQQAQNKLSRMRSVLMQCVSALMIAEKVVDEFYNATEGRFGTLYSKFDPQPALDAATNLLSQP